MIQLFFKFVEDPSLIKVFRFLISKIRRLVDRIVAVLVVIPIRKAITKRGYIVPFVAIYSTKNKLDAFLKKLWPVKTPYELIRIGGDEDGGYLIPNDLDKIGACFSPGVEETSDFEEFFANRKIRCFLADYSVEQPPIINDFFDFEKKFLGKVNDDMYTTLEYWVSQKYSGKEDLILQMDIEGAEYEVLLNTPAEVLKKFRIIVIEFHVLNMLVNKITLQLFEHCFNKILENFEVVHIHPNNYSPLFEYNGYQIPDVTEFTFLRKDRIKTKSYATKFPHPLDKRNNPDSSDIVLPKNWYKSD